MKDIGGMQVTHGLCDIQRRVQYGPIVEPRGAGSPTSAATRGPLTAGGVNHVITIAVGVAVASSGSGGGGGSGSSSREGGGVRRSMESSDIQGLP